MNNITMDELTAELEKVLADKTVTPKDTAIGALGTAVVVVGGFLVVRRWLDRRIERQVNRTVIHQLKNTER